MNRISLLTLCGALICGIGVLVWSIGGAGSNRGASVDNTGGSTTRLAQTRPSQHALPSRLPASRPPATTVAQPPVRPLDTLVEVRGTDGFWQLGRTEGGVWWLISPQGEREFLNTVTTVQPYQIARDPEGPHFISRDYDGGITQDGNLDQWARRTLARVKDAGFKGLGAWCHPIFHDLDVPVTRDLNVWKWVNESTRLYSPQWVEWAENAVKTQVTPLRDNRQLVGYFIDNELDWSQSGVGAALYFDGLPPDDPNRVEVMKVIRQTWPDIDTFNRDWNTTLTDWSQLDAWAALPDEPSAARGRLFSRWLLHLARDYFRITTGLIRKHDPNHLVLGVRFRGWAPPEVVEASRDYTDAQSLNYYVSDGRLDMDMLGMMNEKSGQPVMITEYAFHSLDGRSGNRNTVGFAGQVIDQQARADGYRLFTTRMARVPYIVGADWFQWMDEPPSGRSSDGEDVNFGVVDIDDRPYELLVNAIRTTTPLLNRLHQSSINDDGFDIWRESFATRPVTEVPYLATPIYINGELSDWPDEARLTGIRHSQSIGLERSSLPLPTVLMGWNSRGLYMGFEVADADIQGAPASGWWWTRDHFEFWLATRPLDADQNFYDLDCHQFFFVPVDFPTDGTFGVVGQWKRPGDALAASLIPHPKVKSVTRILPGRYVVEMFIPADALHGWDPGRQPKMQFNFYARNWQHAIDYFWSAPKEVQTQLRPGTWGTIFLAPPARVVEGRVTDGADVPTSGSMPAPGTGRQTAPAGPR